MANKLVLVGGGGHCKSVLDSALRMRMFDEIVITDPIIPKGTKISDCKIVGTDDCLKELFNSGYNNAFITVGSIRTNFLREAIAKKLFDLGFDNPVIVDPSAIVSDSAELGKGTYVGKNSIINADVKVGSHCIINTGAIIEHECVVEDYSHISVGAILCGEVYIGKNSFIGAGSTIIQCLHIGDSSTIGAGAVVTSNILSHSTAVGIPARII